MRTPWVAEQYVARPRIGELERASVGTWGHAVATEAVSGQPVGEVAMPALPSGSETDIDIDGGGPAAGDPVGTGRRRGAWARVSATVPHDPVLLVAAALLLVPALAAIYSARVHPWYPTNDWALIELEVRDVFTSDTPLVGAWSRFDWRHPGPLSFYLMALPYRLSPPDRGLLFAATTVNFAFVAAYAGVALRQPRWRALVALGGLALVQRGLGIEGLTDPWNPTTPILPFALYALLCVELATSRGRWALPAMAFVASLVVQSHVGFAQPTLLMGIAALVMRARCERREAAEGGSSEGEAAGRGWWSRTFGWVGTAPGILTAVVVALCWLPVAIDQFFGSGNISSIVRWTFGDTLEGGMGGLTQKEMTTDAALRSSSWLLNPVGLWIGRYSPYKVFGYDIMRLESPFILLWVPAVLLASVWLVRRVAGRSPAEPGAADAVRTVTRTAILAFTCAVATFIDVRSTRGAAVVWPFRWAAVAVMLVFVTAGWAIVTAVAYRGTRSRASTAAEDDAPDASDAPVSEAAPAPVGRPDAPAPTSPPAGKDDGELGGGGGRLGGRRRLPELVAPIVATALLVGLPVGLTVFAGSLGRRPEQVPSEAIGRFLPAIEEHTRDEGLVVANSKILMNPVDLALPVLLERKGIPWVERDDPRADGRSQLYIVPAEMTSSLFLATLIEEGKAEVLAGSGPSNSFWDGPSSNLVLVRLEPGAAGPVE